MALNRKQDQSKRIHGFDYIRVFAVVLVLVHHQLSVLDLNLRSAFGCDLGQAGVSLFLAISGALAAQGTRSPSEWLWTRLIRIYPAFWIATALGFIAAGFSGYKVFGLAQIISQFAGTGLFTHRGHLVNVATWFISLLLFLYLLVYFAKLFRSENTVIFILGSISGVLVLVDVEPLLAAHSLTFFSSFLLFANGKRSSRIMPVAVALVLLLLSITHRSLAYSFLSFFMLSAVLLVPPAPRLVLMLSFYSYEFYLCHGIFLVGSQKLFGRSVALSVFIGIVASAAAAVVLNKVVRMIPTYFPRPQSKTSVKSSLSSAAGI